MSYVAAAVLAGTAISAGVGVYSANKAASAQNKASGRATDAANYATYANIQAQQAAESRLRNDMTPWLQGGRWALGQPEQVHNWTDPETGEIRYNTTPSTGLINMLEKGPGEFVPEEQPGYRFGYEEFIERPTLRAAAATGGLGGGAAQKALTRYASDYASTQYDNWLNRWNQSLQQRTNLAGMGQNAAALQGNATMNAAANIGNAYNNYGNVAGKAAMASGQANADRYINTANTISGGVTSGIENWLMLRQLQGGGGGSLFQNTGIGPVMNIKPTAYTGP